MKDTLIGWGLFAALVLAFILIVATFVNTAGTAAYLASGKIFDNKNVTFSLNDVSWANLPFALRERISAQYKNTKMSKQDILDAIDFYQDWLSEYAEHESIITREEKEKVK